MYINSEGESERNQLFKEAGGILNLMASALNKKITNKRKRNPDMCMDAVLECTVQRLHVQIRDRFKQKPKRRKTCDYFDEKIEGEGGGDLQVDPCTPVDTQELLDKCNTKSSRLALPCCFQDDPNGVDKFFQQLNKDTTVAGDAEKESFSPEELDRILDTKSVSDSFLVACDLTECGELLEDVFPEGLSSGSYTDENGNDPFLQGFYQIFCNS